MSPIAPESILFAAAAALFAVGALVGRSPADARGLARFARAPRLACAGAGLLCAMAGLILTGSESYGTQPAPVRVTVDAELSPDEVSEEIRVFLDGRDVGVVRVDARTPKSTLRTMVAATGRHDYRLESVRKVKGRPPERTTGSSQVVIAGKRLLGIYYGPDGKVYLLAER